MTTPEAQAIIDEAMRDRSVYERMAKREAEVWGKILPERESSAAVAADLAAVKQLGLQRHHVTFAEWAAREGRTFEHGLSLGCGEGRFEREMVANGTCRSMHGIDVSTEAIAVARKKAGSLPLTYEVADLNFLTIAGQYDLVVAQTCLHHILHLEHVVDAVWKALRPDGIFWIWDYIGETQFQYDDARLDIVNKLLAALPEKYRKNSVTEKTVSEIRRRKPGTLVSPFESIRSEEIPLALSQRFTPVFKRELTTIMHLVAPMGTRQAFAATEDSRTLFEFLCLIDELCLSRGVLRPVGGIYALSPIK
jgi:SAM-dependent methyltransferase